MFLFRRRKPAATFPSLPSPLSLDEKFHLKQELAYPARYYGNGGTIHRSGFLDVEVYHGKVVAVWFRCQRLPFEQSDVDAQRAREMTGGEAFVALTGVEVFNLPPDD